MPETNPNARLEAFSDGVFAIAITLLVLDFKVPPSESVRSTRALWSALGHMAPSLFAFLLSFIVILITWVNHHNALRLVDKSTPSYMYANGLLLLTISSVPFPTALLGEYVLTNHAAPAVVLYEAVIVIQAFAWILVSETALRHKLARSATAITSLRAANRNGYMAVVLYAALAALALWIPRTIAVITALSWVYWLVQGIRLRHHD